MNPTFDPSQLPLRDIHLPGDVAWWPLAFGWWLLAATVVVLAVVAGFAIWRRRRHRVARRALHEIMAALNTGADPARCAQRASIVLRRFAMTMNRNSFEVAGLTGKAWLDYLVRFGRSAELEETDGAELLDLPYVDPERVSADQAMALCRVCVAWVDAQPAGA